MDNLITFSVIAILIFIAPLLSSLLKTPLTIVEILLGAIAYYFGLFSHVESLKLISEIGFLFLMFLCGLEVDLKSLKKLNRTFFKYVFIYFFTLYFVAFTYVIYFDLSSLYIAAFPVMSLGIIMTLIKDYGKDQIWLDLALKIGILGELVSIGVLVVLNGAYNYGNSFELYKTLIILAIFLTIAIILFKFADVLFWWFPKLRFLFIPKEDNKNQDIRFSAMLFFIMITIAHLLGLEAVLGAFLGGVILATYFKYNHNLAEKLDSLGFGFFIPLFFIYIGSTLDINIILEDVTILQNILFIISGMFALRVIAAFIAFWRYFKDVKNVFLFALSDCMPLTFLIATAALGKQFNIITQEEYYAFILAAILEGIIFTLVIKILYNYTPKIAKLNSKEN